MSNKRKRGSTPSVIKFFHSEEKSSDGNPEREKIPASSSLSSNSESIVKDEGEIFTLSPMKNEKFPVNNAVKTSSCLNDVVSLKMKVTTDEDKMHFLKNVWNPGENFNFPEKKCGKQKRKFSYTWLRTYKWLLYSKIEDSAYCKFCILFAPSEVGISSTQSTGQLIKTGFSNWKKARERFDKHNDCQYHLDSAIKFENFVNVMEGRIQPIDKAIDKGRCQQVEENKEKLKAIIKTVIFCGRQGIALRGHRDYGDFNVYSEPQRNEGNFRALLRLQIESGSEILKKHFENCGKNSTYISWNIQNEIIEACDSLIKQKIAFEVNSAKCFTVLADETCDISSIEQFSLCVRYVKNLGNREYKLCEHFLQFMPVVSCTGKNLAETIIRGLQELNIDLNFLHGQGYDGAAPMSGKFRGVQAYIAEKYPKALYIHCVSHSLNLAISSSSEINSIQNCFGIVEKVYNFFHTSKRQNVLIDNINQLDPEEKRRKLKQLCPTRWVQRHDSIIIMSDLLEAVAAALEDIQLWDDKDSSSGANVLLSGIRQSKFLVSLISAEHLLSFTLPLSKLLQSSDIDLASAVHLAENVISAIGDIRCNADEEFNKLFQKINEKAELIGTTISIPRIAKKQAYAYRCNVPLENSEEYYRRSIFLPWIDTFVNQIEQRILKHKDIVKNFMCVFPDGKKATDEKCEQFLKLTEFYKENLRQYSYQVLIAEYKLWFEKFIKCDNINLPKYAIDTLKLCDENIYPNVFNILKIFCTLPVTTCTSERSFSTLGRIKNYLRNSMGENRLNGLANLNIHREIFVDPNEVINILQRKSRRLNLVL